MEYYSPDHGLLYRLSPTSRTFVYLENETRKYLYLSKNGIFYQTLYESLKGDFDDTQKERAGNT